MSLERPGDEVEAAVERVMGPAPIYQTDAVEFPENLLKEGYLGRAQAEVFQTEQGYTPYLRVSVPEGIDAKTHLGLEPTSIRPVATLEEAKQIADDLIQKVREGVID